MTRRHPPLFVTMACLALLLQSFGTQAQQPAPAPPTGLTALDIFGRTINTHGLVLVDWDGYIANPAIKFYLLPPPDAALPAKAVLTADEPRLRFDLPSETGPIGPRKEVVWLKRDKIPVYISIFPDRDGKDEDHRLHVDFTDARGRQERLSMPVHVIDQDRDRAEEFVTVDYSQDRTGFFKDPAKRATIEQAARDWAYFFGDMRLAPVPIGAEKTLIWGPDGFKTSSHVTNAKDYTGYLLYAYGIRNALQSSDFPIPPAHERRLAARGIRGLGAPYATVKSQVESHEAGGLEFPRSRETTTPRAGSLPSRTATGGKPRTTVTR